MLAEKAIRFRFAAKVRKSISASFRNSGFQTWSLPTTK